MPTKKTRNAKQESAAQSLQVGELLFLNFIQQNIDGIALINLQGRRGKDLLSISHYQ